MTQNLLTMTVRTACVEEDIERLPEIIHAWRASSTKMAQLSATEAGAPDEILLEDMPKITLTRVKEIEADPLFQASFSDMPTAFGVVEIDKLIAPQREVNLDYVDTLRGRILGEKLGDLIEFCVGPRSNQPDLKVLQTAPNQMTFSSRSLDLRFLGGFPKPISEEDIRVAHLGGQPAEVVALLVGFGAAPINAFHVGKRLILANGFHRIVALRSAGISKAPIVMRQVTNPDIEFPDNYLGLSRAYLLSPRPVLVKDFFDEDLTIEVKLKPRKKVLKVAWGPDEGLAPE